MGLFSKAKNFVKKAVKTVVDPIIDVGTSVLKAVISPFTGAFDLPDISTDFNVGNDQIKAATTVDFNGANRSIPVLYGTKVTTATVPVWIDTFGADSADTTPQYLYMAAVISQGFHGTNNEINSNPYRGAIVSRITIDGKPVNLADFTITGNTNYTDLGTNESQVNGLLASGKGGVQPQIYTIDTGTFANRLKIQVFDGSSDQPSSSLLKEHPDWEDDMTLSGYHYMALRFELKAADEVITGNPNGNGDGTYGNPYGSVPAVVVTTSGRTTPNIIAGDTASPYYTERFQTVGTESIISAGDNLLSFHRPIIVPLAPDGYIGEGIGDVEKQVFAVDSDTTYEFVRHRNYQGTGYELVSNPNNQPVNLHEKLNELGWTYPLVFFYPGRISGDSATLTFTPSYVPTGVAGNEYIGEAWLKNVGGSHYQFLTPHYESVGDTIAQTFEAGEYTLFGYNITEDELPNTYPGTVNGNAVIRYFTTKSNVSTYISQWITDGDIIQLRVRDRVNDTNTVYNVVGVDYSGPSGDIPWVDLQIVNEDSSAVSADIHSQIRYGSELFLTARASTDSNSYKTPASWEVAFAGGYLNEGLTYQSYTTDSNPVEHLLDYLLNTRYGPGLTLDQIDKQSWIEAAIALDRVPNFYDLDNVTSYMGQEAGEAYNAFTNWVYMYGENASPTSLPPGHLIRTGGSGYDRIFIVDTSRSYLDNINTMLSSMGAYMPFINGKYYLKLENAGIPTASDQIPPLTALPIQAVLTEDNIIDAVSITTATLNDKYNAIKIDYTDLKLNAQPNSVIVPDPVGDSVGVSDSYLAEDNNKVLTANFSVPSIYDTYTAKQYGAMLLKKSRGQPLMNFTCNAVGYKFSPGDFVRVNLSTAGINDIYRITDLEVQYDNTVLVTAIRHVPEFYDWSDTGTSVYTQRRDIME